MTFEYIIQVILFQLAFLLVYEIWLKRETFFNYNRFYLLFTPLLAVLLPFLKLEFLVETAPAEVFRNMNTIWLPEVIIGNTENLAGSPEMLTKNNQTLNFWSWIYLTGVLASLILLGAKLRKLQNLSKASTIIEEEGLRIYQVKNSRIAFTFFNRVFIGDQITEAEKLQIMTHELVHIREKHSLDLLLFEVLKITFWFNPLMYLFQNRLATVHEFIADKVAVKSSDKKTYYEQLLNTAFGVENISFINQFFNHSSTRLTLFGRSFHLSFGGQVKKRIFMLQKAQSKIVAKLKFLVLIPLMMLMLIYVACSEKEIEVISPEESVAESNAEEANEIILAPIFPGCEGLKSDKERKACMTEKIKEHVQKKFKEHHLLGGFERINAPRVSYIPFALIEQVPLFPGCEDLDSNEEQKKCMSDQISQFVNKKFDTSLGKKLGLTGINRVIVQFRIDEKGNITDIRSRAPHPELEKEAERVIANLPKMQPGEQNGRSVSVIYSLPIAFKVTE